MSDLILGLKLVHLLSAAVLLGTGLGIAFLMFMAHRTREPSVIAASARVVVIGDAIFTASAVIVQPVSGVALAWLMGYPLSAPWIALSLALYVLVGMCWLPVVWIQLQLRDLARAAAESGSPLPQRYFQLFHIWFALGWPAFLGVMAIFALMVWKPSAW